MGRAFLRQDKHRSGDAALRVLARAFHEYRYRLVMIGVIATIGGALETIALGGLVAIATRFTSGNTATELNFGTLDVTLSMPVLVGALFVIVAGRGMLSLLEGSLAARLVGHYDKAMRLKLYRAFLEASWAVQSQDKGGVLQEVSSNYIASVRSGLSAITQILPLMANLIVIVVAAFIAGAIATAGAVLALVLLLAALRPIVRRARTYASELRNVGPRIAHHINESVTLAREIRIFDAGEGVLIEAERMFELYRFYLSRQVLLARAVPVTTETAALALVISGLALLYMLEPGSLTPLAFVAILMMRGLLYCRSLQALWQVAIATAPFAEGLYEHSAAYDRERIEDGTRTLASVDSIAFQRVSFGYSPSVKVLHNLTFTIGRGDSVGIVGPSGSGKSTVLQLFMRLRDPTEGRVTADGFNVRCFTMSSWYGNVAYVPQETMLLNRSVRENIAFLRDIPDEQIEAAARNARIHDEIVALPDGYETTVGERGSNLSGGQRQRLAIARALAADPQVVLLDEPTSALDVHSEALIQEALVTTSRTRTLVIVAHRLSTLQACDKILVLKDGHLQAYGPREELEQGNQYYLEALRLSQMV